MCCCKRKPSPVLLKKPFLCCCKKNLFPVLLYFLVPRLSNHAWQTLGLGLLLPLKLFICLFFLFLYDYIELCPLANIFANMTLKIHARPSLEILDLFFFKFSSFRDRIMSTSSMPNKYASRNTPVYHSVVVFSVS